MREKRWVYICDHCGKVELERSGLNAYNGRLSQRPHDWQKLGHEDLCPRCAEVYRRFKKEVEKEDDMDV